MAMTPIKVLLFLAGGTAAAGATAYIAGVFDPYLGKAPPVVALEPAPPQVAALPPAEPPATEPPAAAAPAPATEPPADAAAPPAVEAPAGEPPASAAVEPPAVAPPAEPAAPPAAEAPPVQPPTFVLVRAEADGSLVIAGQAAPSAKVEIVLGSRIIGSAIAGPEGDFAIVLDEPLKPGDYQLVLRSTTPDNVVAMSQETAVVSIPDTADGQVLALVEQPGEAAKLITVPEAPTPDAPAEAPATAEAPAAEAPPPAAPEPAPAGQDVAAAEPQPAPAEPAPAPAPAAKVAVEAVEIEGRKIFVAGVADPGVLLRGYANEILLGEARASDGGRFLIEAERDLAVGDYIIRVDVIGADGVKVIARAAVPFEREPGENLAAVAPPAPEQQPASPSVEPAPPAAAEAPAAEPPATSEVAAAPSVEAAPGAEPSAPATADAPAGEPAPPAVAEAPAAEPAPDAEPAPPATAEAPLPEPAPAVEAAPPAVAEAPLSEPAPPATAEAPAAEPSPAAEPAPPAVAEAPAAEPVPGAEPAPPAIAEAPAAEPSPPAVSDGQPPAPAVDAPADIAAAPAEPGPAEVMAPKLQAVDGAVIIRRGDTLWRISKRVYGRGVRYSTIYLANQEQIRDPDRIWPGQVFSVPETSKEGEPADMEGLGEQAVKIVPYNG